MSVALATPYVAKANIGVVGANRLWVVRVYDGEQLDAPIRLKTEEGTRNAWMLWSHFWRDVKDDDQAVWMDPRLLDRLSGLQVELSRRAQREVPINLYSGYRTPERNSTLEGAARHSAHCKGMAADFVCPGFRNSTVASIIDAHPEWGSGGLGRYRGFTHIDTARKRRW